MEKEGIIRKKEDLGKLREALESTFQEESALAKLAK